MTRFSAGTAALVTGGGSGIGRATALAFAMAGARVAVADISESGEETVDLFAKKGGEAFFVRTDVTVSSEVEAMVKATVDRFGRLDAAFNNAGISGGYTNILDCSEDEWDRVMAVNAKSVFLGMKHQLPVMIAGGGGAIVNTASVAGLKHARTMTSYIASKHAVVGLTRSVAGDFGRSNIRVNALAPGATDTPFISDRTRSRASSDMREPLGRLARPEEQAEAVVWLCSPAAAYVTGAVLPVDGGSLIA